MSIENVKKFYEDLSKDEKLKEKAQKLQDEVAPPIALSKTLQKMN